MGNLSYLVSVFDLNTAGKNIADAAVMIKQIAATAGIAVVDQANALIAAVIALAAGSVIYIYRHRRIKP